jgi:hypothetical protein
MNKSDTIAALAAALAKAQGQMAGAVKDSANPFFKSKYADLSSVTAAIKQPLADNGLSYVQVSNQADDAVSIETIILHESGEWISTGAVIAPVSKHDAQGYGSAQTYARRYSLQMAFGVPSEDDDGQLAAQAAPAKKDKKQEPPKESAAFIKFENEWLDDMRGAAMDGTEALGAAFKVMPTGDLKNQFWAKHGAALKAAAQEAEHATADA